MQKKLKQIKKKPKPKTYIFFLTELSVLFPSPKGVPRLCMDNSCSTAIVSSNIGKAEQ